MQIFAEILPRLGCANVAIMGDCLGDAGDNLSIKCEKDRVWVGDTVFVIPGLELASNAVSGLVWSSAGVSIRLKLKQNEKLPAFLSAGSFNYGGRLKFPPPEIVPGQTYSLVCQCGDQLGSLTPARVLPLPSGSWQADSLDWYCCVNKLNKPPVMKQRTSDLLFNSYSFVVDMSNIREAAVNIKTDNNETNSEKEEASDFSEITKTVSVTCVSCDQELGSLARESLQIWCSSAWLQSGDVCIRSNKDVETAQDCFKMVINSYVVESISAMPKVLLKSRSDQSLVIWIIDKDLTVAKSGKAGVIKESVMKVLFKKGSNVPENTMEILDVSNNIFDAGLNLLESSTEGFPDSFKYANEFRVSYFPKWLNC
eukprot:GFUD01022144.1.p1 GENE.GFUD01022144.1~~GFUD01022144.1.p1  ORF type:complete len:368 (-),score=90.35 GFUD01022144.1:19-1122(-)